MTLTELIDKEFAEMAEALGFWMSVEEFENHARAMEQLDYDHYDWSFDEHPGF